MLSGGSAGVTHSGSQWLKLLWRGSDVDDDDEDDDEMMMMMMMMMMTMTTMKWWWWEKISGNQPAYFEDAVLRRHSTNNLISFKQYNTRNAVS